MMFGSTALGVVLGSSTLPVDASALYSNQSAGTATFDYLTKRITLGGTYVTIEEVYADWHIWQGLDNNRAYELAFRTSGGDLLGGGLISPVYYFLSNGWRIQPMESAHTLTFIGNLFVDGASNTSAIVPTVGGYSVLVNLVIPVVGTGIARSTTLSDISSAVWTTPLATLTNTATVGGHLNKVVLTVPKFIGLK